MIEARKRHFIEELKRGYQQIIAGAHRAETSAAEAAEAVRGDAGQRSDAKSAAGHVRLESAHRKRRELTALIAFAARGVRAFRRGEAVGLGALVDVSIEDESGETEERTLFVLPVGAGEELDGPGGDGFLSVVTPKSPVGRALQGARAGDVLEVEIAGRSREWTLVDLY